MVCQPTGAKVLSMLLYNDLRVGMRCYLLVSSLLASVADMEDLEDTAASGLTNRFMEMKRAILFHTLL